MMKYLTATADGSLVPMIDTDSIPLRDQFAMAALTALGQVFARDWHSPNEYQVKRMAEGAYMVADAMLAARGGK